MRRRDFLAGLLATIPVSACGEGMTRPAPRAGRRPATSAAADILARHGLADNSGFALLDLANGQVIERHQPNQALPPASVIKAITASYALTHLGPGHRYATRLLATGPVQGGTLQGDLVLLGGGDPVLDTDHLADLVAQARRAGVQAVSGRLVFVDNQLPGIEAIEPSQPDQVGYNPGISGLNLNYNRVFFEWKREGGDYRITMDARANRNRPQVQSARMQVANRAAPLYTYSRANGVENWTVARPGLGDSGGRWLPVRDPGVYCADVFRALAAAQGLALPQAVRSTAQPQGSVIAEVLSPPLPEIVRDMLRHSTNLTAEVLGLSASARAGTPVTSLAQSGRSMSLWTGNLIGGGSPDLRNHSGLSDSSRITPATTVQFLAHRSAQGALPELLREQPLQDRDGNGVSLPGIVVRAKTGTMNFTRGLGGYILRNGTPRYAFAIYAADTALRRAAPAGEERPSGARAWLGRARAQENEMLVRWAAMLA